MAEREFFPEAQSEANKKVFWLLGLVPDGAGFKCNRFIQSSVLSFNYLLWKRNWERLWYRLQ
jgi:hypothetical protein